MAIEVRDVQMRFGKNRVLRGVSFEVAPGEVVALAGRNGAGKTTLLDLLMGFRRPTGGELRLLGFDVLGGKALDRVGYVPERPAFPSGFRVRDVLRFQAGSFTGWDAGWTRALLGRLELDSDARCSTLSRGQTGRLALAAALGHRPDVLLLDDPTLGLDPASRRLVIGEILVSVAEEGAAVLLSTHLLTEVERSVDRLLVLEGGHIVLDRSVARNDAEISPGQVVRLEDVFLEATESTREKTTIGGMS